MRAIIVLLFSIALASFPAVAKQFGTCGRAQILASEVNEAIRVCKLSLEQITKPKTVAVINFAATCPSDSNVTGPVGQARFREHVSTIGQRATCDAFISGLR